MSSTTTRPGWLRWAVAAGAVATGAVIFSPWGNQNVPEAAFAMTSLFGPQDGIDCDNAPYSGYTVLAAGSDLYVELEDNGSIGESFCFRAGRHTLDEVVQLKDDMVVVGEKGAIFDGGTRPTFTLFSGSIYSASVTLTGVPGTNANICSNAPADPGDAAPADWPTEPSCVSPWDVWWGGKWVDKEASTVGLGANEAYLDYTNDVVYLGFNPGSTEIVVSRALEMGISDRPVWNTNHVAGTDADNVTFKNIIIEHVGTQAQRGALDIQNGGWLVENVEIRRVHGMGLSHYGGTTRYSVVHHIGQLNIGAKGENAVGLNSGASPSGAVDGGNFYRNEVHSTNLAHYWPGWEGGHTKFSRTLGYKFVENYMHHGPQACIWYDINNRAPSGMAGDNTKRGYIVGNWCSDFGQYVDDTTEWPTAAGTTIGRGIFYEISCECYIADNTVVRTGLAAGATSSSTDDLTGNSGVFQHGAVQIAGSWDMIVTNNEIDHNGAAITLIDQGRDEQDGYCRLVSDNDAGTESHPTTDVQVYDNTVRIYDTTNEKIGAQADGGSDTYATLYPCGGVVSGTGRANCDGDGLPEVNEAARNNDFYNNTYYLSSSTASFWKWDGNRNWTTWTGTPYSTSSPFAQDTGSTRASTTWSSTDKPCSITTPDTFNPTEKQYAPTTGTFDVWVLVDATDIYADKLWYDSNDTCPEIKEADSTSEVWMQTANAQVFGSGDTIQLRRYDNDLLVNELRIVPDAAGCVPTGTGDNCATSTVLSAMDI